MRLSKLITASRWTRLSTRPLLTACAVSTLACAGCTTIQVDGPKAIKCLDLIPPELQQDTPHATPPGTSQASHGEFEIAEAGQLNKANEDKRVVLQICRKVDDLNDEMRKQAEKRTHHWWQF